MEAEVREKQELALEVIARLKKEYPDAGSRWLCQRGSSD